MTQVELIPREVTPPIEFKIGGAPLYQGSKIALISGKREMRKEMKKGRMVDVVWVRNPMASLIEQANRKTKTRKTGALTAWKERIALTAARLAPDILWQGRIELECIFVLPRSPSHFTTKGVLTKSAPMIPGLDLDKMVRAVGDALTKVIYYDDVQIVGFGGTTKRFSETSKGVGGVFVKVTRL